MIRISCTNCKTILSIDDAFAGGVCRCQHCGTIQTVPAQARGNASTTSASGHAMGGSKTLYQNGEPQSAGTGLDDLASVVVSSGLTSNRLKRTARSGEDKKNNPNLTLPILLVSGVVVLILIFVIVFLWIRINSGNTASTRNSNGSPNQSTGGNTAPPAPTGPNFCSMPLTGNTVIYVLDHGQSSAPFLGDLKEAVIKSAGSLTAERKFEIIFWSSADSTVVAYPDGTTTYATPQSIESAMSAIGDPIVASGAPDVASAMKLAVAQQPDEIVIATSKGLQLESAWVDDVMAIRGNQKIKIDTINLVGSTGGESGPLKRLAGLTGGSYRELSLPQLKSLGQ